ncbi:MAG TPA: DUF1820 family protein [Gammaproteobacteria bacterium]|jgi:hypothetical protein|nr:DUF1820 family protein [Gammaproteobacteria bacterium]
MPARHIFKITFMNQGKIYEVYARKVSQEGFWGFIEVEQLVFGERSGVVVDPGEEKLKDEFAGVKRTYIPMHAVIRIDEVAQEGVAKIVTPEAGSNVTPFPMPVYTPGNKK